MSPNTPQKRPATWSPEMLKEFHKFINTLLPIGFTILEKHQSTTFLGKRSSTSFGSGKTSHISYRGIIPVAGFENISVIFDPVKTLAEEYRNYIGYIEVANGSKEDTLPGPEIRGFFQENLGIGEIFNEMLIESKMFNSKMSPIYIYLEQSYCLKDKAPEELLKKRIPIREISTFQKISCIE
jgi:hypothetical protein